MVNKFFPHLLDGLFPHYCYLCGLRSLRSYPLCRGCESDLQPNNNCCQRCALPLAAAAQVPTVCGNCLQHPPAFERVIAPWLYCEHLAHLIHRWKYSGHTQLTPLLAHLWLSLSSVEGVDLLVPTPLHWRRIWQRGFNQCDLLCQQLRRREPALRRIPLERSILRRSRATAPQSDLPADQRRRNLRGAFTSKGRCDNLRVAVVDDVLTTGATANAMAETLLAAGADAVEIWCLARTPAPGRG